MQRKGTTAGFCSPGHRKMSGLLMFCVLLISSLQQTTVFSASTIVMPTTHVRCTTSGVSSRGNSSSGRGHIRWRTRLRIPGCYKRGARFIKALPLSSFCLELSNVATSVATSAFAAGRKYPYSLSAPADAGKLTSQL